MFPACGVKAPVTRSGAVGHGMLAEDRELQVTGPVRVAAVHHHPVAAAAGHARQGADRFDDLFSSGIGQLASDEVIEHVQHEQRGRHPGTLLPHRCCHGLLLARPLCHPDTRPPPAGQRPRA